MAKHPLAASSTPQSSRLVIHTSFAACASASPVAVVWPGPCGLDLALAMVGSFTSKLVPSLTRGCARSISAQHAGSLNPRSSSPRWLIHDLRHGISLSGGDHRDRIVPPSVVPGAPISHRAERLRGAQPLRGAPELFITGDARWLMRPISATEHCFTVQSFTPSRSPTSRRVHSPQLHPLSSGPESSTSPFGVATSSALRRHQIFRQVRALRRTL